MNQITPENNHENHLKNKEKIKKLDERTSVLYEIVKSYQTSTFERFPILFGILGAIGLALTVYGFEKVLEETKLFAENPEYILGLGIVILLFTGSVYKILD